MSLPARIPTRPPRPEGTPDPLARLQCSHCRAQMNKFGRIIRLSEEHAETFGDAPNRVGRMTTTAAAVFDTWPCLQGWVAEHFPQP